MMHFIPEVWMTMRVQSEPKRSHVSPWQEAMDLLRFSLEAALLSGAIILIAWFSSGAG